MLNIEPQIEKIVLHLYKTRQCDKESYLSWLTFINVAFPYMQQTYFHLIMSLHLHALSFPKHSKTY